MDSKKKKHNSSEQREHGSYYTHFSAAIESFSLLEQFMHPSFLIEPYVGNASLIRSVIMNHPEISGVGNDIDQTTINALQLEFANSS